MNRRFPLAAQLLVALFLGCVVGLWAGPKAAPLGGIGLIVITLLKALATPLVFLAVVDAFCKTEIKTRDGFRLVGLSTVNAVVATFIALSLCHVFPAQNYVSLKEIAQAIAPPITPGQAPSLTAAGLPLTSHSPLPLPITPQPAPPLGTSLSPVSLAHAIVPSHVLEPFVTNNVIAVVFLALLFGAALRAVKNQRLHDTEILMVEKLIGGGLAIVVKILGWVVHLVPIAAFSIVAKVVGTTKVDEGFAIFRALTFFVVMVATGMIIHVGVYYAVLLKVVVQKSPWVFFKQSFEALMTALSTGSSLATLPVTLRTLQEKMKVSTASARLAACVGTNFNHVGILLYELVAALFVAQIQGRSLSIGQQMNTAMAAALAAVGIAGIPEAGLITLSLVLTAVGLPLAAVPLLLPVDWLLGRFRATTNVASDMTVALILDRPGFRAQKRT